MKARNLLIVILLVGLLFVGCSKSKEETKKEADNNTASVPVPPKSGVFPKDIPIYPYQQQLKTQSAQRAARATFMTTSDIDAVISFYEEKLPEKKWNKIGTMDKEGKKMLTFKKEHAILHVTLDVNSENQFTNVTLLVNR